MQPFLYVIKSTATRTKSNTCIDHIHTNQLHHIYRYNNVPFNKVNHKMIFAKLINSKKRQQPDKINFKYHLKIVIFLSKK